MMHVLASGSPGRNCLQLQHTQDTTLGVVEVVTGQAIAIA